MVKLLAVLIDWTALDKTSQCRLGDLTLTHILCEIKLKAS